MRSLIRGERPVIRSDGTLQRDYLYVQDAVYAYMTLAECLDADEVKGQAFNFGMDKPTSVLKMVQAIVAVSDRPDLEPVVLSNAPNEIPAQYMDSSKAHRLLNWASRYSLEEGLRETFGWYREFLE
jgi:CDP-glucose 4,6-dehydratase